VRFSVRALAAAAVLCMPSLGALPAQGTRGSQVWQIVQPPQSSLVYSADGSLIGEIGK
jgi:hypothetical protein